MLFVLISRAASTEIGGGDLDWSMIDWGEASSWIRLKAKEVYEVGDFFVLFGEIEFLFYWRTRDDFIFICSPRRF